MKNKLANLYITVKRVEAVSKVEIFYVDINTRHRFYQIWKFSTNVYFWKKYIFFDKLLVEVRNFPNEG